MTGPNLIRILAILAAFFLFADPVAAQTVVDETDSSCIAIGNVRGLDPQGDNFLSVRRRPGGPSGLADETDRLFTNDRVCVASTSGHWLNVKYMRFNRMYSGWVYDRYIGLVPSARQVPAAQPGPTEINFIGFKMPSGNIICNYSDHYPDPQKPVMLECVMRNHIPSYTDTDCRGEPGFDSGSAGSVFVLTPNGNRGEPACLFDQVFYFLEMFDQAPTLDYGQTWSRAGMTCKSDKNGLTCTNMANHGFFLSRAKQAVF